MTLAGITEKTNTPCVCLFTVFLDGFDAIRISEMSFSLLLMQFSTAKAFLSTNSPVQNH